MIEQVEKSIAKESNDVMDLIVETVKVVREKGDYTSLVDDLIKAISGADAIGEEVDNLPVFINTIGGRLGDLYGAFTVKKDQ